MQNIEVYRYPIPSAETRATYPEGVSDVSDHWQGYVQPEDLSWILFVAKDGSVKVYLHRDPATGAVLD